MYYILLYHITYYNIIIYHMIDVFFLMCFLDAGGRRLRRTPLAPQSFLQQLELEPLALRRFLRSSGRAQGCSFRANRLKARAS